MKRKLRVLIENEQDEKYIRLRHERLIRRAISETLDYENFGYPAEVSVVLTDSEAIKEINREYRGVDSATDVLSFPQFAPGERYPDEGFVPLGDIVISVERAENQALVYGHSFERELAFLTVHSTLHLLGYDNVTCEEDELDMRRRQRDIMERIGLTVNGQNGQEDPDGQKEEQEKQK